MDKNYSIDFANAFNNEIVITGIVRNISKTFSQDYTRLNKAFGNFKRIKWFLVESDSEDDTLNILKSTSELNYNFSWCSLGDLERLKLPRAERLSIARNRYVEELQKVDYSGAHIIVVADFNGLSSLVDEKAILSCWKELNWSACTANQSGRYYDVWALRHALWSPNDCWKQYKFFRQYTKIPELTLFSAVNSRMIKIPVDSPWIEVQSAFGGLAIYDATVFKYARYSGIDLDGEETCEHVEFNRLIIDRGGKIYINPSMINTEYTDHSINSGLYSAFARVFKYPKKKLKQIKSQI